MIYDPFIKDRAAGIIYQRDNYPIRRRGTLPLNIVGIEQAVGERIVVELGATIAWPNQDFTPSGPYVELRLIPGERIDDTIAGGHIYETGIVLVTVVYSSGGFSVAAGTLAAQIADLFPKALRLVTDGGNVLMYAPAAFGTPFQDGAYWRQPVRVFYITEPS